jgi:hypothetical protein
MLILFKKDGTPIQSFTNYAELYRPFANYKELYRYITHEENERLFEDHPQFSQTLWSFLYFSPQRVSAFLPAVKKKPDGKIFLEAYRLGLGVVEVCEGDLENVRQILVTADVDVEALRKEWCKKYCDAHGYLLSEISSLDDFKGIEQVIGADHDYIA